MRKQLPQRRAAETVAFEHDGVRYVGTLGRFSDGTAAEVFMNSSKIDTSSDINARDAAIAASLALQYGCPVETLQHALARKPDGSAMGPLGKFLDLITKEKQND